MARSATNVCWASLSEKDAANVQALIDTKPEGWADTLCNTVIREVDVHEMCGNYIKADHLREWYNEVIRG